MQLDKFAATELMAKEYSEADENDEKGKEENEAKENIAFIAGTGHVMFTFTVIHACYNASFSKGFVSNPYNPPDLF